MVHPTSGCNKYSDVGHHEKLQDASKHWVALRREGFLPAKEVRIPPNDTPVVYMAKSHMMCKNQYSGGIAG